MCWRLQWQEKSAEVHLKVEFLIFCNPSVGKFATGHHILFFKNYMLDSLFVETVSVSSSFKSVQHLVIRVLHRAFMVREDPQC